jgi:hypothetical protein
LYFSAAALMESVLALRQPLSDPTWANPITEPSSIAGSTAGSSPPAVAEPLAAAELAALDADWLADAALVLLDDAVVALLPHAARVNAATAAAASTANFFVTTGSSSNVEWPRPGRRSTE